jgi:hypothetical protein
MRPYLHGTRLHPCGPMEWPSADGRMAQARWEKSEVHAHRKVHHDLRTALGARAGERAVERKGMR